MFHLHLTTLLPILSIRLTLSTSAPNTPPTCTVPPPNGYELIDDTPLINTAIATCGPFSGTILIPSSPTTTPYSIRSQIDLTPCAHCDIQLEAPLLVSRDEWTYWNAAHSIIKLSNVSGATIRSLTGKGGIDGNAVDYYWRERWPWGYGGGMNDGPHFMHITNSSSNIFVEGLSVWNVPRRFFRIDGGARDVLLKDLDLRVRDQWNVFGNAVEESESFGVEVADARDISIVDVSMDFRCARDGRGGEVGGGVGVCVAIDRGTSNITVENLNCVRAIAGVAVMIGTSDFGPLGGSGGRDIPVGHDVQDVLVKNLTYGGGIGGWATGWANAIEFRNETVRNVVWDGVEVLDGSPVLLGECADVLPFPMLNCIGLEVWMVGLLLT
ncbi:glycoside hydrolase family 28 protein [Lophiostoma macrostomum CBS 122681]|uniref:Glycoside hydrolase family 28 protein n=1 Tax=Lophiostoma macrostomum CBS 122681 TaxID=1314788 RepID=A0A6A6TDS7_9PLEO|nr:glycoside hydrolase family 28 protein [Lophiostoma macrostomum CBS 122681]